MVWLFWHTHDLTMLFTECILQYLIAWGRHGYWMNKNYWAWERRNPCTHTLWDFWCHLLLHIPITSKPQSKICLQQTLSKLLSINNPFNYTTVSEWLRFFYSEKTTISTSILKWGRVFQEKLENPVEPTDYNLSREKKAINKKCIQF